MEDSQCVLYELTTINGTFADVDPDQTPQNECGV